MTQQKPTSTTRRSSKPRTQPRHPLNQRTVMIGFLIICLLALLVFVIRNGARSTAATVDRANATNTELVAQGRRIYITRCASCHGADLQGAQGWPQPGPNGILPATPLDASGPARQRDDQWLFTTIKQGGQATAAPGYASAMPAFSSLTDTEIWAVISYIKSTWPKNS